jgi:pyruvate formate lyase activating enzyme
MRQSDGGIVFNIQHYSVNDGPGIRTIVFLKGCPLRCKWCGNPESQLPAPELMWNEGRCIQCRCCKKNDPGNAISYHDSADTSVSNDTAFLSIDRTKLPNDLEIYSSVCPAEALCVAGKNMTVDEVIGAVEEDSLFYGNSSGGITLSGGEPLLQGDFAIALLREARQRYIHTAIETTGYVRFEVLREAAYHLNYVLYDIKTLDDSIHKAYTSVSNKLILSNLKALRKEFPELTIRVRTPVIPGVNDTDTAIHDIRDFLDSLGVQEYELLPYHRLGVGKYAALDRTYDMPDVELAQEKIEELKAAYEKLPSA